MKKRLLTLLLTLMIFTCATSLSAVASTTQPTTIGAPEHFGASHYLGDYIYFSVSAPEDLRAVMASIAASNGKTSYTGKMQIDYKLNNGDWRYTNSWDTAKTGLTNTLGFTFNHDKDYINHGRASLSSLFPNDKDTLLPLKNSGWDFFKSNSLSFRVRFVLSFDGGKTYVYSNWSNTYVFSQSVKSDPDKLINHAPTLTSAKLEKHSGGAPFIIVKTGRLPGETQDLNAMAPGEAVWTEVWMRKAGEKDFRKIHDSFFANEYIQIDADDYFGKTLPNYSAEKYEIKIRYKLDLRKYKQSGRSDTIYSPFSNVFSQNMPAWSAASKWATPELQKANDAGLIPDIIKGADMTKAITREEFATLAVRLYEKVTGTAATAATSNPFADTQNPEVLKAYKLGIVKGISATTFVPKNLTNREQVAAMLSQTIRILAPNADFSVDGAPVFSDQQDISSWAQEHVKLMSKLGIIKGSNGKFMPKATTTAQQAAGYATTTREQAIAMSVRILELYKQ